MVGNGRNEPRQKQRRSKLLQSVVRAGELITLVAGDQRELGITELSRLLHLSPSTVYRLVASLESQGLLQQNPVGEKYDLGPAMLFIGRMAQERLGLSSQARPIMEKLAELADEGVNLGVLRNDQVLYVERVESRHILQANLRVGTQVPAHCTAIGKILLAYGDEDRVRRVTRERGLPKRGPNTLTSLSALCTELAAVRDQGFAIDDEEFMEGIRCLAAPVRNERGEVVAGLAITGPATRLSLARLCALKGLVVGAAAEISERLGCPAAGPRMTQEAVPGRRDGH